MVGRRTNLDLKQPLDFDAPGWKLAYETLLHNTALLEPRITLTILCFRANSR